MELKEALIEIYKNLKERLGIEKDPKLILKNDKENSKNIFGRTAYYAPNSETVVLYITGRHPKDICRSFAHELVHHHQNERGDLNLGDASSPNYAQEDGHMRKMEMEAYLKGNMFFRDFEDNYKKQIREYTGTGAGGRNHPKGGGNLQTSPRPFPDDESELKNYNNKNVYGGDGKHYKHEPAFKNPNRSRFTRFEETMKKSDIHKLIKEIIQETLSEVGANAYGSATLTSQGQSKSRFTKTGRPPGILDEEDALVTRAKKIIQILNKPEYKKFKPTFDKFIKDRTDGRFSLPSKINDKTDGDILALLNLKARDFSNIFK